MIDDRTRQQMNDYLDDRLEDEERRDFEQRLNHEPELSLEVRAARQLREALRSGDEDLSPGFYTRAVAKFEAEQRPRARLPFGLTWSTAGLATVAIAAAAIFIPMALRDEIRETPASPKVTEVTEVTGDLRAPAGADETRTADKRRAPAAKDDVGTVGGFYRPEEGTETESSLADAEEPVTLREQAQVADGRVDALAPTKKEKQDQPVSSVGQTSDADRLKGQQVAGEDEEAGTSAARERKSAVKQEINENLEQPSRQVQVTQDTEPPRIEKLVSRPAPAEVAPPDDRAEQMERSNEVADALLEADPDGAGMERGIAGGKAAPVVTLPEGSVPAGTVELRAPLEAQRSFADSDPKTANVKTDSKSLSSNRPRTGGRLLVIGSRPGLDACDALEVLATTRTWEVRLPDSGSATGSVSCAIAFPNDGREIRFLGEPVDD